MQSGVPMNDVFAMEFMRNALMAGFLVSITCGIIGSLVVVNRIVFLAGGIAHTAYGGVGIAFYFGLPVMACTAAVATAASMLMAAITLKKNERSDTVIGVLWAGGMALGIILLDITPGYNVDLMSYLFGSILTVSSIDIIMMLVLNGVILLLTLVFYNHFLIMSFDEEYASTRGISTLLLYMLLLIMVALSVVMIIRVVGLILVIALLTIPPYLAERFSASLGKMMIVATLWSMLFCFLGLILAYQYDITSGASIIAVATVTFFMKAMWDLFRQKVRR